MKFDLVLENLWARNNKELQEKLKLNPLATARTYPGLSFAIAEAVKGLVRLYPHRKSFAVLRGSGPFYKEIVEYLSMEGLQRTDLSVGDLLQPDEVIKRIPKDCLFLLGSYDDPMTGELFNVESLYETLHKNRTFTICLNHSYHLVKGLPNVSQYMVVLTTAKGQGAISFLGQKGI